MNQHSDLSIYQNMVANPLAPMTLRIGVAGHRTLPADQLPRLREEILAIYTAIGQAVQAILREEAATCLYARETPIIRIISSLAEGADRLCMEPDLTAFDGLKLELACIFPFLKEEFEKDFLPKNSVIDKQQGTVVEFNAILERIGYGQPTAQVIELDGNPVNRDAAYNHCSRLLVAHSDILIAVYDGDDSEDTGTAIAVKAAKQNGIPVIHISTLPNTSPWCFCSTRFGHESCDTHYTSGLLHKELHRVLLFSDELEQAGPDNKIDDLRKQRILARFKQYQTEENLKLTRDRPDFNDVGPIKLARRYQDKTAEAFDMLKQMMTTPEKIQKELKRLKKQDMDPAAAEKPKNVEQQLFKPSLNRYFAAYLRADRLANYYASIHRSTFLLIYLLGAAGLPPSTMRFNIYTAFVLIYLLGVAALLTAADTLVTTTPWIVQICVLVALVLTIAIFVLYWRDHRKKYHDRWLEYRCLAEFLRPMCYLSLLGRPYVISNFRDTDEYLYREVIGHSAVGRSWLYIYIETINRWAGFNACRLDSSCKQTASHFIRTTWLNGQISYHTYNAAVMRVLENRLEQLSFELFFAAAIIVIGKLTMLIIYPGMSYHFFAAFLAFFAVILPIYATTFYAIRKHAKFDSSAKRSLTIRTALVSWRKKLRAGQSTLTSAQMAMILNDIVTVTIKEISEWIEIYEVKGSELE